MGGVGGTDGGTGRDVSAGKGIDRVRVGTQYLSGSGPGRETREQKRRT